MIYDENYLKNNGIDMTKSLELLEDMEMYNETLHDFLNKNDSVFEKLTNYKNNGDMENYAVEVHSLKSDCKYLGFTSLADIAYEHELKSKDNDLDYVNNNFDKLVAEKNRLLRIIEPYAENN